MKKQIVKGLTMFVMIMAVALATAVVTANGQSVVQAKAHIPFEFVVGDQTLSSGDYVIRTATSDGKALIIQNSEAGKSAVRLANGIQAKSDKTQPRLVFHRYGQNYFLAEVWQGGDASGRRLLESQQERALRRELKTMAQGYYETVELVATLR